MIISRQAAPVSPFIKESVRDLFLPFLLLLLSRLILCWSAPLLEPDYDQAIPGLMAMEMLSGHWSPIYWGQPYMGTLEPSLAALFMLVGGVSLWALRGALILESLVCLVMFYLAGRMLGGRRAGVWCALIWALPPIFLAFMGLYATGGHMTAFTLALVFAVGIIRLGQKPTPASPWFWLGLGMASGLSLWCSLITAPLISAALLGLIIIRPGLFKGWSGCLLVLGGLLGSSPLWYWNLTHDFMTLRAMMGGSFSGGNILSDLWGLLSGVYKGVLSGAWWDGNSVEFLWPPWLRHILWLLYLPVLLFVFYIIVSWFWRLLHKRRPFADGKDILALMLLAALFAHVCSAYGQSGVTRYALPVFVPFLPLLGLSLVWGARVLPRLAPGLGVLILFWNVGTLVLYWQNTADTWGVSGMAEAADKLKDLGIHNVYISAQPGYPLSFTAKGQVTTADFHGWRNYAYRSAVDDADRAALGVYEGFSHLSPAVVDEVLQTMGLTAQKVKAGRYFFWHDFTPPLPGKALVPRDWRIYQENGQSDLEKVLADRNPLSVWPLAGLDACPLLVDLGRVYQISRLALLPFPSPYPRATDLIRICLEVSLDGQNWQTLRKGLLWAGLIWRGQHLRQEDHGLLEMFLPGQTARFLRITFPSNHKGQYHPWPLAEIFVNAVAAEELSPLVPKLARENMEHAQQELACFFDEPSGPHPGFPGVPPAFRQVKVDWLGCIASLDQALTLAPAWEELHLTYMAALTLGELWQRMSYPLRSGMVLTANQGSRFGWAKGLNIKGSGQLSSYDFPDCLWNATADSALASPLADAYADSEQPLVLRQGTVFIENAQDDFRPGGGTVFYNADYPAATAGMPGAWGPLLPDPLAAYGVSLAAGPESGDDLHYWLPPFFLKGSYAFKLRLRGQAQDHAPLLKVSLLAHQNNRVLGVVTEKVWSPAGADYEDFIITHDNQLEPIKFEVVLHCLGTGRVWLEGLQVSCLSQSP